MIRSGTIEAPRESFTRTTELAKEYPLVLITDGRFHPFFHSEHRVAETPRKGYPRATLQIRPDTAKNGISLTGIRPGSGLHMAA